MITMKQVLELPIGYELHHRFATNADGSPERWRINGKVQTWKTRPRDFKVPVKRGLRQHSYITQNEVHHFCLTYREVFKMNSMAILRDLDFTRKPDVWASVKQVIGFTTFQKHLEYVEKYTVEQIYEQELLPHPGVLFTFIPEDTIFILVVHGRVTGKKEYLINTEGYEYPKYVAEIQ